MFWADWSTTIPRIMRAWMDGSNARPVVYGLYRLRWPNGLAIDEGLQRIYFTDAMKDRIISVDLNGGNWRTMVAGPSVTPHPFAISVFKVAFLREFLLTYFIVE